MRGGPQNLGMCLANNTSGLNALRFFWRRYESGAASVHVAVAAGKRRTSYSLPMDREQGLRLTLRHRRQAGYPVTSLAKAVQALEQWLKKHPRP